MFMFCDHRLWNIEIVSYLDFLLFSGILLFEMRRHLDNLILA